MPARSRLISRRSSRATDVRPRHLIITGGNGYIGQRLVERALAEGWSVTLLGRRPGPVGTRHIPWLLGEALPQTAFDPVVSGAAQALVHLAHDWQAGEDLNVGGTERLFASAQAAGIVTRVFISSQSARDGALNRYGRMKYAVEQRIPDATALRVGLVYGGPRSAMYGLLCRLTRLPVLPMVDPHRTVQPIHLDEVVRGILAAAEGRADGVLALTGPDPVPFGTVLKTLAQGFGGRGLPILPIPLRFALSACDLSAVLPLVPTVDRERVLGLAGTQPIESGADLARLGVQIRPMAERLAGEPAGRRALLAEGRAFLRYIGIRPSSALLRRYVRALPEGAMRRSRLPLRLVEPLHGRSELGRRLRIASRIAEASLAGEVMLAGGSRFGRLARLAATLTVDAAALPARMLATVLAR